MWNKVVSTFYDHVLQFLSFCVCTLQVSASLFVCIISTTYFYRTNLYFPPFFYRWYPTTRLLSIYPGGISGSQDGELPVGRGDRSTDQGSHASNTLCHVSSCREDYVSISTRLAEASGGGLLGRRWSSPSSGIGRTRFRDIELFNQALLARQAGFWTRPPPWALGYSKLCRTHAWISWKQNWAQDHHMYGLQS